VPLMVKWPGVGRRGTVSDVPVISTDLYPSILEMIGVPARPKQHIDGLSFAGLVKGGKNLKREAIYWHFPHYSNHGMQSPGGAIRRGDYKLLEYFENDTVQLFNLRDDVGEQRDLSREQPQLAKKMTAMLRQWRTSVSAAMTEPNPDYKPAQ
jgi:arylsulfatase A